MPYDTGKADLVGNPEKDFDFFQRLISQDYISSIMSVIFGLWRSMIQ